MTISEKVAYLKGLAEGLNLDTEKSKEGKLISVMIGILEEVGLSLEDLDENTTALGEELDAVSDDLADVEEIVYGDDEDEDECGCGCEDEDFFEVECPNCGEDLEIDESVLETGSVECPNCGEKFAIDLSDEDDGCGCGCDHDHGEDK
ncbi:CD1247 N-terminal domain-containing protein [Candidatus Pseudoscillospira sp. SGI.172]|uniref:CD1247 N-terminal domain-containing protein n=1 Tax=Candidatus Pseudoscillospira sp. SGI.172 TaxID=3420582 RepID=UPI003D057DBE